MTSPEAHWRAMLAQGQLVLQRTRDGRAIFPPRVAAPGSGDDALEWFASTGTGSVYSFSWVQQRPPKAPYNVALIDLDDGVRVMSRVENVTPDTLHIGLQVEAVIDQSGEAPLLLFRPVGA
ncbi:hypothetical protein NT2_07_01250 [Caenibius tardaugens NBRC 16725]|uniref:ChsH2 C-terminal OB-fold domain-containing protein n=1 Tax=Caenibius tardaugens NBRC 16725 TaxID=1219035 RepID=U2YMW0_9SPHN|nr:OB-fold domain-containing protein [Caenibius tardaugens]AZI35592.1 hypothetical protein EGO55_06140 [Caenibius tardaugens NBRC 16725]GAD50125.1 hypothetical protein NT2_07_01250 [Caenibius tardaugens NBRC 16725]